MDDRAGGYCIEGDRCTCNAPPRDDEARIERAALAALDELLRRISVTLGDARPMRVMNAARAALAAAEEDTDA